MMTHRAAARVVGALFITATGSIILSVVLLEPVVDAPDFLTQASVSEARVAAGVLLELVNNIAVVGIAVVIYPVLKPFSERLALGYVAARSIESVLFTIGTGHLLTLLLVSHEFVAAGAPPASHFHTLGGMLLAGHDLGNAALAFTAFSLGTLMLNYVLYRARLVPRWISAFGPPAGIDELGEVRVEHVEEPDVFQPLLGSRSRSAVFWRTARVMLISGLELSSATVTMLDAPIFLQEMVVAVWLIVRGFDASALAGGPQGLVHSTE